MPVNSINDLWAKVCDECKKQVTELAFNTFFKFLTPEYIDADKFVLSCENEYLRTTLESLYKDIIKNSITAVTGLEISPEFIVANNEEKIKLAETKSEGLSFENFFTFDNFIVGSSNKFAYTASMAVAEKDSIVYNPLIIYGPSGIGKTHLLLAIKNYILNKYPFKKVVYTRGEDFTNQLIEALQKGKAGMNMLEDFREKYRKADVLLIDDIHFIAGKEQTQEEFFNTFNTLYQSNKQIVVTIDRPLKDIKTLDDRIRSRFSAGLFADITPPDFETRVGIIKKKAEQSGITINDNIVYYIAEHIKKNIRQIEGVVKKLGAYIKLQGKTPNLTVVQEFIKDVIEDTSKEPIKVEKIISEVARTYNVSENDILSNRKTADLVLARQVAMYISRETTDLSYKAIGESFGKDHTTVLYNVNRVEEFLKTRPYEKELIDDIIKNLLGDES
ncbi:MAG: chromosomal replication initiator protein DnaA [Clostridia bacterium]|nr:chromosomal replication initiator protein DnaA [Clostridia bacterium]MBR3144263.1 chromosomal replication initiator protein DnaA [Clostridia bacterium]